MQFPIQDQPFRVKYSVSQLLLFLVLSAHTAHEQATITALIQNISLGRQGLEQRKVLKRESFHNIHFF